MKRNCKLLYFATSAKYDIKSYCFFTFLERLSINERRNYHLGHPISSRFALDDRNRSGPISEPKAIQKQNLFATKAQEKPTRKLSTGLNVHRYTNGSCYVFSKPFISSPSIPLTHKLPSNAWI